ncbi:hypothetical protein Tco_0656211 [Tanacetum coccineum]|uniref:Uncharacterized protein n=1 Tax=Tanacetum coccineum TaxID=301880 RepID=A0ABQ4X854_9ASTR
MSHLTVLGASQISHFGISCRVHGGVLTIHLFRQFYLATTLPPEWITIEKRRKNKNTTIPVCHIEPFDSLKGWRNKKIWVNASMAPISMRWFNGGEFPWDSLVDGFDVDMTLETILNDNPTWIIKYSEEFLMRLQDFVKVANSFDVTCGEETLEENERPLLERTSDVVTQPLDQLVNLASVPIKQEIQITTLPPPIFVARKRAFVETPARESASKNQKGMMGYSSGRTSAKESTLKLKKDTVGLGSWKAPMSVSFIVSPFRFAAATKAGEFIPVVTSCPAKRFKSSLNSSRSSVSKKPVGYEVGSRHLVTSTKHIRTATYLAYTHSQPLVPTRSSPLPSPISRHILGIINALVEDSAETRRQDNYFASICVDPDAKIARLKKLVEEKPSGEVARLRLGKEEVDREVSHIKKQVGELKSEADKVPGLLAHYSKRDTELSTMNGTYADLLREKTQLEYQNSKIWTSLDARHTNMDREYEVEITLTMRDAIETKKWDVSKGFRYFLNKFKESDLLGTRLGACISATIADAERRSTWMLLEQLEACVDEKISYIRALLVMEVDEPKKDEVATIENPASGSPSSAGGGVE